MVSHWSLSDSKSPQVSRPLFSILAVLNNAVIWIVSTRPPNSKSSRPFNNPLLSVTKAPITIGTMATFMFHSLFNSLARSKDLSFFSHSFSFFNSLARSRYLYYYYYYTLMRVFHTGISWWLLSRVWVRASLLKSTGLFSVFWPILIMM